MFEAIKKIKQTIENFGKEHEIYNKYQITLLQLINKMTEIRKLLDGFNNRLVQLKRKQLNCEIGHKIFRKKDKKDNKKREREG